ncbi:lipoprotein [Pseudomonas syringae pv. actinidiae ICMP 19071]|uniref:hypothetical protein n=1 Tax=Pseudomonas syringae TaxID=317 RepID=UPI000357F083|nr:hypothetical protein [Pseudomonas syringae]EPM55700.1 lipoprotein [Pseudomonas syringae pv. actinidiae ICMP 19071]EPM75434.1 lipoprotein [Pseudomonas syringae pv. actinidiae ICMP 19072]OSN65890.1 hypothetical protein BV349_02797 [Pseudomonas syringae pv. actinidiae]OSN76781.1 hypothetical protein BV351_02607 [Pseudomonas syringae pv. actinidiae]RMS02997.1 hypothetical protein ALP75_200291 [Pseudomonas syringae pv. actinidiae]
MNALTTTVACLAFASLTSCALKPAEHRSPDRAEPSRTISLAENSDGGGNNCTFNAKTDQVWLNKENHSCKNDEMSYIKLDNVRSAVVIELRSNDCDENKGWTFKLRTIIDPVSTAWISIDQLRSKPLNTIITRGVLLVGTYDGGENITGKFSCVNVTASTQP